MCHFVTYFLLVKIYQILMIVNTTKAREAIKVGSLVLMFACCSGATGIDTEYCLCCVCCVCSSNQGIDLLKNVAAHKVIHYYRIYRNEYGCIKAGLLCDANMYWVMDWYLI
nr:hypothetical protein [Halimeda borneensis]